MVIKIKYLTDIKNIEQSDVGDWIDLRSAYDYSYKAGECFMVRLGVAMQLPMGYEAHILPRSSTFKKWGIIQSNSMGIIDNTYCGDNDEWCLPVIAMRDGHIHKNDRICQFRIMPVMTNIAFRPVASLENKDRGGFGSTGVD